MTYQGWRSMDTAPKSVRVGASIQSHYILGYCPEDGVRDPQSCLVVIWWEPNMDGGKGLWWCDGEFEAHPTHWHPLPCAPTEDVEAPGELDPDRLRDDRDERRRLEKEYPDV